MMLRVVHRVNPVREQSPWRVRFNGKSRSGDNLDKILADFRVPEPCGSVVPPVFDQLRRAFPHKSLLDLQIVTE